MDNRWYIKQLENNNNLNTRRARTHLHFIRPKMSRSWILKIWSRWPKSALYLSLFQHLSTIPFPVDVVQAHPPCCSAYTTTEIFFYSWILIWNLRNSWEQPFTGGASFVSCFDLQSDEILNISVNFDLNETPAKR